MARRTVVLRAIWAVLLLALAAAWWSGRFGDLLAGLPAVGYFLVMVTFARTLRRGQEPLITQFCRLDFGRVPDECRGYTRRWTWAWAVLMGIFALEAVALPLTAAAWAGRASVVNVVIMVALFLGEHRLRARVFPHLPIGSPLRTGRIMFQALRSR